MALELYVSDSFLLSLGTKMGEIWCARTYARKNDEGD